MLNSFLIFTHSKTKTKKVKAFLTRLGFKNIGDSESVHELNISKQKDNTIVRTVWIDLSKKQFQECWYAIEAYTALTLQDAGKPEKQRRHYEIKSIEDLKVLLVSKSLS